MESAIAYVATKESIARKWTALIRLALAMVSARRAPASVRRDGKEQIVARWTKKRYSVCPIAADMEISILRRRLVYVSLCGLETTARKVRNIILTAIMYCIY